MANKELVIRLLQALLQAEVGKRDITPTVIDEKRVLHRFEYSS